MSDERPEYVVCIKHIHEDLKRTTWCGNSYFGQFCFQDLDHAFYNAMNEGRLVACPKCVEKALSVLREGLEYEKSV